MGKNLNGMLNDDDSINVVNNVADTTYECLDENFTTSPICVLIMVISQLYCIFCSSILSNRIIKVKNNDVSVFVTSKYRLLNCWYISKMDICQCEFQKGTSSHMIIFLFSLSLVNCFFFISFSLLLLNHARYTLLPLSWAYFVDSAVAEQKSSYSWK